MPRDDVDEAARIFLRHTTTAIHEMQATGLDTVAVVQAVVQMSMRTYADLLDNDTEAIRQIRGFLEGWERDLEAQGAGEPNEISSANLVDQTKCH
ncbi:hypothetical protein DF026_35995 [Burkholderia stagnalis]|nr:hypothetical protein DF026_35995 [Burkholderia stagnalis]